MYDHVHIRLLAYHFVHLDPSFWHFSARSSSFWRFYCNDADGAWIEHAGQRYDLEQGHLYFIPARVRFSANLRQRVGHLYIHFDLLGLPYTVQQENFISPICLSTTPVLLENVYALRGELEQHKQDLLLQLRIKAILYEALLLHLQNLTDDQIQRSLLQAEDLELILPALHYIETHLEQRLTNTILAQLCYMTPDYFIRSFRQRMGSTPIQYIQEQRVKWAEQQLLMGKRSIKQIAAASGFGSRHYFTRIFTRHTGVSPAAYRKGVCGL